MTNYHENIILYLVIFPEQGQAHVQPRNMILTSNLLAHTIEGSHKHTCLTGSGILFLEQAVTSCVAVSREILCPTDTYTGLEASSEVRNACMCDINM